MIFRLVRERGCDRFGGVVVCRVWRVSRSSYYAWLGRRESDRLLADPALLDEIREIQIASRATYGAPRVHADLMLRCGYCSGRQRIA